MNAQEARKLSEEKENAGIGDVLKTIKQNCNKGFTECWYYKELSYKQKELLRDLGYKLSQEGYDRNEYLIKIEW